MRWALAWMAVIFALSAWPDLVITQIAEYFEKPHHFLIDVHKIQWGLILSPSNPFFDIPTVFTEDYWLHKAGHCLVYAILGLLTYRWTRRVLPSIMVCIGYAFFDELHQALTHGRSSRLTDVLIDTIVAFLFIRLAHAARNPDRTRT
ncbi:VanZ family protein [Tumebacillus permanentifrigoris]|uniref:VanZ like protein n=1 Tax=Tumebacillus permanentifrigoris TaxID=378543 RepID=A0A316D621_9BACL|nr:VanZ family protein [Tumebacillus permanentifrigoris]PWK09696.1 VanZ like protein [Tumebacillus permanentifrigoris]